MIQARRERAVAGALIALGAWLRLAHYMHQRSLWLDEAKLALNVVQRDYAGLLTTLDRHQGAPIGFLWISKFAVHMLGNTELALRLFPLLAGLAVLPLTWRVARRVAGQGAALIALGIVAVAPRLIYQSSEFKQYSSDTFCALLILLVAMRVADRPLRWTPLVVLALVGLAGLVLSHPAVFVLVGAGAGVMASRSQPPNSGDLARLSCVAALWVLAFGTLYVRFLRPLSFDATLIEYWADGMSPHGGLAAFVRWPYDAFFSSMRSAAGFEFPGLAGALVIVGCIALAVRDWRKVLLVALPVLAAVVAAVARMFPFTDRLILFVVPLYAIMIGAGVVVLAEGTGRLRVAIGTVLLAVMLVDTTQGEVRKAVRPGGHEEVRDALRSVARQARAGDVLYVYDHAQPAFEYYRSGLPDSLVVIIGSTTTTSGLPMDTPRDFAALDGHARVWTLFAHAGDDERRFVADFDLHGKRLSEQHLDGAATYLYDFTR